MVATSMLIVFFLFLVANMNMNPSLQAGYSTHYIGKLMNQYNVNNYDSPAPPG